MKTKFYRGDRVTVVSRTRKARGRVVCHNRKNAYGLSVVVLVETERGTETIDTFTPDGKRYLHNDCHLVHGWEGI